MKLAIGMLVAFIIFLAGMGAMVSYMFFSERPAVVTSLTELIVDLVIIEVAIVLATIGLLKLLKEGASIVSPEVKEAKK
ncbi:hypothetical protein LCGC14_0988630 [marine sediment metagenome]|uniref:Uncharacterized protein n=1 Tax=marine sediment metagenome TaxID=412755 RepID=A0A0F9NB27_9ZZZZ